MCSGSRIIQVLTSKCLDITLLDSMNFLPMGLASLQKAFDDNREVKGFFPYFVLNQEPFEYIGAIPPMECFDVETINSSKRVSRMVCKK